MRVISEFSNGVLSSIYSLGKIMTWDRYYQNILTSVAAAVRQSFLFIHGVPPLEEHVSRNRIIVEACCANIFGAKSQARAQRVFGHVEWQLAGQRSGAPPLQRLLLERV